LKIGAIQPQLPARRQTEQQQRPTGQVVGNASSADQRRQGPSNLTINELPRTINSVGRQRAIDFYIITEAISGHTGDDGDLIGIDTFA
jgi:hypothetical protein